MKELKNELKELTALIGISSREDEVVKYMYNALKNYTDDVSVDMLGNVTAAFKCGQPDAQKVLFFGHMDEIGLIVKKVESNGYLRLERLSAVNNHVVSGAVFNVRTHNGEYIRGVVGAKSHHFMQPEEKNKVPELSSLALDIGCNSKQEVNDLGISEGCVVAFEQNFIEMPHNIVATKSLDDRVALLTLIHLAKYVQHKKLPYDLYIVASVQEEFSIRGIMPAVTTIEPDVAIGIDITPSGDSPDIGGAFDIKLGAGPAFTYYNYHGRGTLNGIIPNEALVHFLEKTCEENGIHFQREVSRGVLTETAYVAISGKKGVATANISVPCRYTHTAVETASLDDLQDTINLVCAFADGWSPSINLKKINI